MAERAQTSPANVSTKLQEIGSGAQDVASFANEHAAEINHGAFQLGHLIRALLKHTPNIIKESFVEAFLGGEDLNLLSVQKIYNIASNEKFGEFVGAMNTIMKKHGNLLENLSGEDNSGIIQIFKELKNNEKEIQQFLEKAKENSSKLEQNYACATKLMMHVLIGKEEMEKISTTITSLKQALDQAKESINKILAQSNGNGVTIDVSAITQKLDEINNKAESIKDPCPTSK